MTDHGRKDYTYAGNNATLRVDAIRNIAMAKLSASSAGLVSIPPLQAIIDNGP